MTSERGLRRKRPRDDAGRISGASLKRRSRRGCSGTRGRSGPRLRGPWRTRTLGAAAGIVALVLAVASCELPVASGGTRPPALGDRAVYIVNSLAETLSVFDPDAGTYGTLYDDVIVTGQWPNAVVPWNGRLYVVNSGDNSVQVIDEATYEELAVIRLGANRNPWTLIIDPDRGRGYVPNFLSASVSVIDLATNDVETEITGVGTGPEGGCYMDGYIYVGITNYSVSGGFDEGRIAVIDASTETLAGSVSLESASWTEGDDGANPQSLIAFPDREEVHAICTGVNGGSGSDDGKVVVVDASVPGTWTVTDRLSIGGSPIGSADSVEPSSAAGDGAATVYLSGVGGVSAYRVPDAGGAYTDGGFAYSGSGSSDFLSGSCYIPAEGGIDARLLVCGFSSDRVLVLDPATGAELASFSGSDGPQSPALWAP